MDTDQELVIKEKYLGAIESNLSTLFAVINTLLEAGEGAAHANVFTLSVLAMNIAGSVQDVRQTAKMIEDELPF